MESKQTVRNRMKVMRRNLPTEQVNHLSTQICGQLFSLEEIRQAEAVLLYAAVRKEADLRQFAEACFRQEKAAAFPRVRGDRMDFYRASSFLELVPGAFGIPEPSEDAERFVPAAGAVILVPGVAFMENGNRIGMGKGYYDRYLADYPDMLRIGIAYEAQLTAVWEPDARDLPVDLVVTEERVIYCDPQK